MDAGVDSCVSVFTKLSHSQDKKIQANALRELAVISLEKGDNDSVIKTADYLLSQDPYDRAAILMKGWALLGQEKYKKASQAFESMTETKLRLDILVGTGDLYAEGTVTCRKKLRCARCLKDMEVRFSGEFQETFSPEAEFIDIMNIVRETAMLSQEPRYVCDESCKGLCPICGANLNEKECGCVRKTAPSPFDVLKEKYGSNSH